MFQHKIINNFNLIFGFPFFEEQNFIRISIKIVKIFFIRQMVEFQKFSIGVLNCKKQLLLRLFRYVGFSVLKILFLLKHTTQISTSSQLNPPSPSVSQTSNAFCSMNSISVILEIV